MRTLMLTLAILGGALTLSMQPTSTSSPVAAIGVATLNAYPAIQDVKPPQAPQINVEVKRDGGGGRWYMSPVWVAIGAIAAVLVILLIVLAARGSGGTTVLRG
jgi:hypothetical protein